MRKQLISDKVDDGAVSREHPEDNTLRMNGRTRFVSLRYCGSKTSISPNFVCQRVFTLAMHRVVDEFLSRSLSPGSRPIAAARYKPHFLDNRLFDRVGS
jgi:hypothetical protein